MAGTARWISLTTERSKDILACRRTAVYSLKKYALVRTVVTRGRCLIAKTLQIRIAVFGLYALTEPLSAANAEVSLQLESVILQIPALRSSGRNGVSSEMQAILRERGNSQPKGLEGVLWIRGSSSRV